MNDRPPSTIELFKHAPPGTSGREFTRAPSVKQRPKSRRFAR